MPSPVLQLLLACGLLLAAVNTAVEAPGRRKMKVATEEDDRERERNQRVRYTASWAVEITGGGDKMADVVARRHGYRNLGKVGNFDNIYHFVLGERERARAPTNTPYTAKSSALLSEKSVGFADQQYTRPVYKRSYRVPRDPRFRQQWHLLNTGQYGDEYRGRDLKIEKVWMQGLSGCNVTVGVVDDGFEYLHPDLRENYVGDLSISSKFMVDESLGPNYADTRHSMSNVKTGVSQWCMA
jgi:subtilisin family serine protease